MTRRPMLILVTLCSALVLAGITSPVRAGASCSVGVQEQCAQVTDDATLSPAPFVVSTAGATEQRPIYRVSGSYLYVPASGGMWLVIRDQTDGLPVIEDYVSGPPPVNGVALTP